MEVLAEVQTDRVVGVKFDEFPEQFRARLLERITDLTDELDSRVHNSEPYRTGKLRAETEQTVESYPNRITGRVSVTDEFAKAATLEYGSQRSILIRSHTELLNHVYSKLIDPISVVVAAHQRHLNIEPGVFLRGSVLGMKSEIEAGLQEALTEAIAE